MAKDRVRRRDFMRGGAAAFAATAGVKAAGRPTEPARATNRNTTEAPMPYGEICGIKISRLLLGSNPLGGGAHSRDLVYVSRLLKEYNTEERVLKTLEIAESEGINTILQGNAALVKRHNTERGGRLRQIRPLRLPYKGAFNAEETKIAIDQMMTPQTAALYVFGDTGDYLAKNERADILGEALDLAGKMGVVLGVGGHSLEVVKLCVREGLKPAFYLKTFHDDRYWSATPKQNREPYCWYDGKGGNSYSGKTGDHNRFHDNIWCLDPEETSDVMRRVEAPWIAFKVLAAGALHPKEGFDYAFRHGADFVAVGMLDYQLREDSEIVRDCVTKWNERPRPWRA